VVPAERNHYGGRAHSRTRMHEFGSSGVRGVAYDGLAPADALAIAQATGAKLAPERMAIARDTRLTGETFADAVASGLTSVGVDVDRLGVAPTPALQVYCEDEGVPAVMVTASHNPPEYNGLKLVGADGVELTRDVLDDVEAAIAAGVEPGDWEDTGQVRHVEGVNRRYREQLVAAVDAAAIAAADLTVAIDPGHGAGALTSPDIFRELGCRVLTINAQPDGRFPGRDPEPVESTLGDLQRLVETSEADLGIAHDGDADRAIFVDETGDLLPGGATLAALADAVVETGDVVVSAANASQRLVDVCETAGATLERTRIGSTYLITAIRERQAAGEQVPIAGEDNGGVLFPDYRITRDGAYTAARFCELLAEHTASEAVAPYDGYTTVRRDLSYADEAERAAMLDAIREAAAEADVPRDETDGIRLDYDDGWVLARPSGTEPVVRVYAESTDAERANELADWLAEVARDAA
jgi:phosphomannomutase/phosphoglucomutase